MAKADITIKIDDTHLRHLKKQVDNLIDYNLIFLLDLILEEEIDKRIKQHRIDRLFVDIVFTKDGWEYLEKCSLRLDVPKDFFK